jgi:hypothetical protein
VRDTTGIYIAVKVMTLTTAAGSVSFGTTYPLAPTWANNSKTTKTFIGSTTSECGFSVNPHQTATLTGTAVFYKLTVSYYSTSSLLHSVEATSAFVQETHFVDVTNQCTTTTTTTAIPGSRPRLHHAVKPSNSCTLLTTAVRWTNVTIEVSETTIIFGNWTSPTTTTAGIITETGQSVTPNVTILTNTVVGLSFSNTISTPHTTTACYWPNGCFDVSVNKATTHLVLQYRPHGIFDTPTNKISNTFSTTLPKAPSYGTARIGYILNVIAHPGTCIPSVTSMTPATGPTSGGTLVTFTGSCLTRVVAATFTSAVATGFSTPTWTVSTTGTTLQLRTPAHSAGSATVYFYYTFTLTTFIDTEQTFTYITEAPKTIASAGSLLAALATGSGYWTASSTGGVFAYGTAKFKNSLPGLGVHVSDITGIAATCDGGGYWLVGRDGGVFAFGDATFTGSLPQLGVKPYQPIVAIEPSADCGGYYLLGADGGVFAFGDATFEGSLPLSHVSVTNAVGLSVVTGGYFVVASDGGVFCFGTAKADFHGSLPGLNISTSKVIGMVPTPTLGGYYLVGSDGGVFAFGNAVFVGSEGGTSLTSPVIGLVLYPATSAKAYSVVDQLGAATTYNKLT